MKGVIDSVKGEFFRCLLENGDLLNIHSSEISSDAKIGDVVKISVTTEKDNTK